MGNQKKFMIKGSNISKAIGLLNTNDNLEITHIRCGGHVLNLIIKKVLNISKLDKNEDVFLIILYFSKIFKQHHL